MTHKHDPGAYHCIMFDSRGRRRRREWITPNLIASQVHVNRWVRRTGGSGVVMRCAFNSQRRGLAWEK